MTPTRWWALGIASLLLAVLVVGLVWTFAPTPEPPPVAETRPTPAGTVPNPVPSPDDPVPDPSDEVESACVVPDDVERVSELRAGAGVDCASAAAVAAAYDEQVMAGGDFPEGQPVAVAGGFVCATEPAGPAHEETFAVHCQEEQQTVRFHWGV